MKSLTLRLICGAGASLNVRNNMAQIPDDVAFGALDLELVTPGDLAGSPLELEADPQACDM